MKYFIIGIFVAFMVVLFVSSGYNQAHHNAYPLSVQEIQSVEHLCKSFGGVKSYLIKAYTEKDTSCVFNCNTNTYYFVDYVICNNGAVIQEYDDVKGFK